MLAAPPTLRMLARHVVAMPLEPPAVTLTLTRSNREGYPMLLARSMTRWPGCKNRSNYGKSVMGPSRPLSQSVGDKRLARAAEAQQVVVQLHKTFDEPFREAERDRVVHVHTPPFQLRHTLNIVKVLVKSY